MNRWIVMALLAGAALAHAETSPAKKELVAKVLALQQPGLEAMSRQIVQGPVVQLMDEARRVVQTQVPADKREAVAKSIEADAQQFVDEAVVIVRDNAAKLAPGTVGAVMEEKFTEDELKQLIAWLESPVNKKYQQLGPQMQQSLVQKMMSETGPALDAKLQGLQQKIRVTLGLPEAPAQAGKPAASGAKPVAKPAARPASK